MGSSHITDILTSFSPTLDLFAICLGDGRIKIWDTGKGQVQTEFLDISTTDTASVFRKQEEGHLSMDYTCMKWLSQDKKKKRKLLSPLLVLGTGGGDVLALDVFAGQLKWRFSNCHPGGVSACSSPKHGSHIYTAGADGTVCQIDTLSGNLLNKFKATSKAISCLAVSPDGNTIATAAAQLKVFNSSTYKKLQKFSGHPGAVRCMVFSEDGRYVLSSAIGERYIAVWKIGGSKKKSASVSLAMEHPAIFLDSRCVNNGDTDDTGFSILAISEMGICYFWHGKTIDDLNNLKPTKICIHFDNPQKHKGPIPSIFAAKLQSISEPSRGHLFLACGLLIKPTFEKVTVHSGTDIKLDISLDGILLPISQSSKSKKALDKHSQVIALDRSNAEGALLPVARIHDPLDEKDGTTILIGNEDQAGLDSVTLCMEDRLRSLGILSSSDDAILPTMDSKMLKGINLSENTPKKMKVTVSSMESSDAFSLLKSLVDVWQFRSESGKHVLPWICCILVYHSDYVKSQDPKLVEFFYKVSKSKMSTVNSLFQLSGRLQLVSAQVDNRPNNTSVALKHEEDDESGDEEVDEVVYGVDEDSESGTDSDD